MENNDLNLDIYDFVLEDEDEVFAVSLVEDPAIQTNFVFFSKESDDSKPSIKKEIHNLQTVDKEKRIVMGPALVPEQLILRKDKEKDEMFYGVFGKEQIRKASEQFMKNKYNDSVTLNHLSKVNKVTVVENWIVEDTKQDKSSLYGYTVPEGTWMMSMKIEDDTLWDEFVRTGEVKGFSIEAQLSRKIRKQKQKFNNTQFNNNIMTDRVKTLVSMLNEELSKTEDKVETTDKTEVNLEKEMEKDSKEDMKYEDKEKKEKMEEKVEDEVKMAEVDFDLGTLNLPEDFAGWEGEIEVEGTTWMISIQEVTETESDESQSDENVESPREAVADEFSQLKAENAELRDTINKLNQKFNETTDKVELSRESEGKFNAEPTQKSGIDFNKLRELRKNKKQ